MPDVKHAFTSAVADGGDATLVRPSNWNAIHEWPDAVDVGNLTLTTDGQFSLQFVRLQLSSTNRMTLSGDRTRIVVFGSTDGSVPNLVGDPYWFAAPFRVPRGYFFNVKDRLILEAQARGVLENSGRMMVREDDQSARIVLVGRG